MFLRLKSGNVYKVRLVAKPIQFMQHWEPVICRSPGKEDPLLAMGYTPKERYSIWVLDRNDNNQLKIMDFPPVVYKQIGLWKDAHDGDNPGGEKGPDFQIKVEGQGRRTRYSVVAIDRAPFTEEELARIRDGNLKDKLAENRRGHTPEEIRALLAEKNQDAPSVPDNSGASSNSTAASSQPAESGSTGGDDLDF